MSRRTRVLGVCVASVGLAAAVAVFVHLRAENGADDAIARAEALLATPIERAPEVDRLPAASAVAALEEARALRPDHVRTEGLYHLARSLVDLQRGDLILADGEATSARHRLGETPLLQIVRAAIAFARTDARTASDLLAKVLRRDPRNARARSLAADVELGRRAPVLALEHLDVLVREHPTLASAHHRRGLALLALDRLPDAELALRRAARLDGRSAAPWIDLGQALRQRGRTEDALAAFDIALRRDAQDPEALLGRGLCRAALGDENAAADFRRAAALAPNDAEPLLALGDLQVGLGDPHAAVRTYRDAIARESADAASWLKLGNALVRAGREAEAEPAYREAIQRAPDLAASWNGLGAALVALERADEARQVLQRAATLDPSDPNPPALLALLGDRIDARNSATSRRF
ncbi:MAG: tetratricopeptide repeat protein [Deltaproteobacteria bacterium]|nr:tetratricopeptide repeat protein [Deltaproteobacteria bacterium]